MSASAAAALRVCVVCVCLLAVAQFVDPKPYDHKRSHISLKSFRDEPPAPYHPPPYNRRHHKPNERWMSWSPLEPADLSHPYTATGTPGAASGGAAGGAAVSSEQPASMSESASAQAVDVEPLPNTEPTAAASAQSGAGDACAGVSCHYGRVCMVTSSGVARCECGGIDYCVGHNHRVCGTDGYWYPSHCELHRRACVEQRHIGVDHANACQTTDGQQEVRSRTERISTGDEPRGAVDIQSDELIESREQDGDDLNAEGDRDDGYDVETLEDHESDNQQDVVDVEYNSIYGDDGDDSDDSDDDSHSYTTICTPVEYDRLKLSLLTYHCARIGEEQCVENSARKQFVANIMFNYYDGNEDQSLSFAELADISERDHLAKLSQLCRLTDILNYDDPNSDHAIDINEFYVAFNIESVILSENLRVFTTIVTVGNSIELKCDVRGSNDIVWKRNDALLEHLTTSNIHTYDDGSLYIGDLGIHHMGNYSCQDRHNDDVVQTHVLRVQMPPRVQISPQTQFHTANSRVVLKCHSQSIPDARVTWQVNENDLPQYDPPGHYQRLRNNMTLMIQQAAYTRDTGAYKCKATNNAGTGQAIATVFIENDSKVPRYTLDEHQYEEFMVFHDKGYTIYEPTHCHIKHTVTPSFNNFKLLSDYGVDLPTLCNPSEPCVWGDAVNVKDKYIYVTQPTLNRIVVIEIQDRSNPVEIISTDHTPVRIQYFASLDQLWVVCWNDEGIDSAVKTLVMIKQASLETPHKLVHTQPIADRFDTIMDAFLPENNDLGFQFSHGYVVHSDQEGLYKLQLDALQYDKNIDLTGYNCQPTAVAFVPIAGHILVHCTARSDTIFSTAQLVVLDAITDAVRYVIDSAGVPYVSPDSRHVVLVNEQTNVVQVYHVDDNGELTKQHDFYAGLTISDVHFFPSDRGHSYDVYFSSKDRSTMLYMNLYTGETQLINDVGAPIPTSEWPWSTHNRRLHSGGVFADHVVSASRDSVVILDGRSRRPQCEWQDITHANTIVWMTRRYI